jgi:peptidoglycan/LPS O-acetylase OafA/YrhL
MHTPQPRDPSVSRQIDRLLPLTGLRGIAAYSVLIAHAITSSFQYGGAISFYEYAQRLSYFGMSLFFVLSGFVIEYNYMTMFSKQPLGSAAYQFFIARFARLYPLYALTLVMLGLTYIPSPYFAHNTAAFLSYLTLTQSWFNMEMATFPPFWSISTEWFFYFAFVPLTLLFPAIRRPLRTMVIFAIAAALILGAVFWLSAPQITAFAQAWFWHNDKISASGWGWASYFSPYARLPEFVMGVLAAKAYSAGKQPGSIAIAPCFAWCVAVILISPLTNAPVINLLTSNFIFAPAIAFLMLYCCQYDTWLTRILSARPLLFAGEISYSVYIWSWSVITLLSGQFVSTAPSPLAYFNSGVKAASCVFLTTVFAFGSYLLIESPSRAWIRRVLAGDTRKARFLGPATEAMTGKRPTAPP